MKMGRRRAENRKGEKMMYVDQVEQEDGKKDKEGELRRRCWM